MENQMNRVRTEVETGIEEEKSESIPVFVCVKTDGRMVGHSVWARRRVERPDVCGLTDGASGIKLKYR